MRVRFFDRCGDCVGEYNLPEPLPPYWDIPVVTPMDTTPQKSAHPVVSTPKIQYERRCLMGGTDFYKEIRRHPALSLQH